MKVLIADDSQIMRKIIRANLLKLGIEKVYECGDGATACRMLAANPDTKLLFTDLNMPNLNGYDLIKQIRSLPKLKDLEIIVISDRLDEAAKHALSVFGVTSYVPKPFNLTNFNETTLPIIENIKNAKKPGEVAVTPTNVTSSSDSINIEGLFSKEQPAITLNAEGLTVIFNDYILKAPLKDLVKISEIMEKKCVQ